MSDLSQLLSNSAQTNADFDFSKIGKSYWEGKDQTAKTDLREAFKGGVPTNPDGSIDYGSMQRTLYQKGALEQGNSLMGPSVREGEVRLANSVDGQPQQSNIVSPPSANRSASTVVAPPLNKGGEDRGGGQQPQQVAAQPQGQPTVMTILAAQGIPNHQLQAASDSVARQLGTDPTAPLDVNDPQVRNVLAPAIAQLKRSGIGQVQPPQPGDNPPQVAQNNPLQASPIQIAAQTDPVLRKMMVLAGSDNKQTASAWKARLESYLKNKELTPDQKNAAASGQSLTDYQNRTDENAAQLAIVKDLVLPELKVSKEGASAARTEIQSMYRAREQLDAPGGIFSGTLAQQRLKLAKAAEFFGVPNTDKITNTEAFVSAMGAKVVASLKALGVNPSNKDLAFAEKMAGSPELKETSLRRILDIGEQAARDKIDRHNTTTGQFVESNEALKPYAKAMRVDAPGAYTGKKATAEGTFNSTADVHAAIKAGKLQKGDSFTDPSGKTRYVP